jgi:hypothetical protein
MANEITIEESKRLILLEEQIKRGLDTFVEVGEALLEIRDSRLYRIEHETFEAYCREKWGMSRQNAHELIGAALVNENLSGTPDKPKITAVSQARPMTKLEPEQQKEAWNKAVEMAGGEQPTAKIVEAAVLEVMEPTTSIIDHEARWAEQAKRRDREAQENQEPISPEGPATTEEPAPCEGMAWAEKAIKCLEKIKHNDAQKKRAYNFVRHWLSLRS